MLNPWYDDALHAQGCAHHRSGSGVVCSPVTLFVATMLGEQMQVGSRAHFTTPPAMLCAVCQETSTAAIVPTRGTRMTGTTGKTVHLTTMRLCTACRAEVVAGRITLGWSREAERWGVLGKRSPVGDRYVRPN
jgi:hypothetical protein